MKLHGRRAAVHGFPRELTCLDSIMAEMLNCVPDAAMLYSGDSIKDLHKLADNLNQAQMIYRFMSGAALAVGPVANQFFIYSFINNGNDSMAAEEELKFLDYLRLAKQSFLEMKRLHRTPQTEAITLRVTKF